MFTNIAVLPETSFTNGTTSVLRNPVSLKLLAEASKAPDGNILSVSVAVGRIIQAGQTQLGDPADRRTMARWEYALEQLLTLRLLRQESSTIFTLTDIGYRIADQLAAEEHR
jgi:hypothetical protein